MNYDKKKHIYFFCNFAALLINQAKR